MAEKSAANVVAAIAGSKDRELWRLINGLGILHVGEGAARKLAAHFRDLDALAAASVEELQQAQRRRPRHGRRASTTSSATRATGP